MHEHYKTGLTCDNDKSFKKYFPQHIGTCIKQIFHGWIKLFFLTQHQQHYKPLDIFSISYLFNFIFMSSNLKAI